MGRGHSTVASAVASTIPWFCIVTLLAGIAGAQTLGPGPKKPSVLLRAGVSPAPVYVGEQTLYSLELYTQADITGMNPQRLPDFQGFWVHELPQPEQLRPVFTELDGDRYGRVSILQRVLFPLRAGVFSISGTVFYLSVKTSHVVDERGLRAKTEELQRRSNGLTLEVRPLPTGAPAGFSGAVGEFELSAEIDRTRVEIGRSLVLSVRLSGDGNLQALADFKLPQIVGLVAFEPERTIGQTIEGQRILGERTWLYPLQATHAGVLTIPTLEYPTFDPATGRYRMLRSETISFTAIEPDEAGKLFDPTALEPSEATGVVTLLGIAGLLALVGWLLRWRFASPQRREVLHRLRAVDPTLPRRAFLRQLELIWGEALRQTARDPAVVPSAWSLKVEGVEADRTALAQLAGDLEYLRQAPELAQHQEMARDLLSRSKKLAQNLRYSAG